MQISHRCTSKLNLGDSLLTRVAAIQQDPELREALQERWPRRLQGRNTRHMEIDGEELDGHCRVRVGIAQAPPESART